jgi:acyl-CoA synthetase (NDP forming)
MNKFDALDTAFNLSSVAIIGVAPGEAGFNTGRLFLSAILEYGFPGRIYPVHPDGGEVSGLKVYPSIGDIPEAVDYVISCIRAPLIPELIRECSRAGTKVLCLFTAGFSETGIASNRELEHQIGQLARETGVRVIGPNCMGIFSPRARFSFGADFPKETGRVGLICQSGGNTIYIVRAAGARGIAFGKAISYGNGSDIDETDLLDYFRLDSGIDTVAVYIEGVRDGSRFRHALHELAAEKPVVVLKGGRTPKGASAVASHTASLAGSDELWSRVLQHAGVIQVDTLDEIVDMLVTLSLMSSPGGKRVVTLGMGGGAGVLAADDWDRAGFAQPPLPEEIADKFRTALGNPAGTSMNNPIDVPHLGLGNANFYEALRILLDWEGFDFLAFHLPLRGMMLTMSVGDIVISTETDTLVKLRRETTKPMAGVIHYLANAESWQFAAKYMQKLQEAGIPIFYSVASAAKAVNRLMGHRDYQRHASGSRSR